MQKGNVNFIMSQQAQQDEKNNLLTEAQNSLEKAVNLNSAYYEAMYSLGLVYDGQGQKNKAIEIFNALTKVNPSDEGIAQILKNLNSGFPALLQATPPSSQTPPESLQPDSVKSQPEEQQSEE
jgi:tetratricopeptide (TPR) repeat protein